ncbi:RHS repeat-associated core domain-containing protein, partial [Paracidovorax valerianellae]
DPTIGQYVTQDPIGLNGGINKSSYPVNPMNWTDPTGLDPTSGPKGPDIGSAKGWYDKIKDMLDFKENVQEGRDAKTKSAELTCKRAAEREKRYEEGRQNKLEDGAAVIRDVAAGEVSEGVQLDISIGSAAKLYGYWSETPADCATLLKTGSSSNTVDFFKK